MHTIRTFQFYALIALSCFLNVTCRAESITSLPQPAPIRFLLSFDDGPSAGHHNNPTEQILDTLTNNVVQPDIKAIFFAQTRTNYGGATEQGRKILQREWDEGHLLAFHTATPHHTNHRHLNDQQLQQTLENGIADLTEITGSAPKLVRPPFWSYDKRTFAVYQKNNLHMLLTDLSANDGKIWGVNFSLTKYRNMYKQLAALRDKWHAGKLPVVDGSVPIVVTFHDVNRYTANNIEEYLQILLQVAAELNIPTATLPFYTNRDDLERAALANTLQDVSTKPKLPGLWDWFQ